MWYPQPQSITGRLLKNIGESAGVHQASADLTIGNVKCDDQGVIVRFIRWMQDATIGFTGQSHIWDNLFRRWHIGGKVDLVFKGPEVGLLPTGRSLTLLAPNDSMNNFLAGRFLNNLTHEPFPGIPRWLWGLIFRSNIFVRNILM